MCLSFIDEKINREICTGIGWKVFRVSGEMLFGDCQENGNSRPLHKWLNEKKFARYPKLKYPKIQSFLGRYPRGWHIFATEDWADAWAHGTLQKEVREVEYKSVLATGEQNGIKMIVARWIRIGGPKPKRRVQWTKKGS